MNNNFESQQMRRQQQHYSYNKNNHIQPYTYQQNPATCNFNINPLTYISNNIQSPHALNVHPNTLNTNINPHKTYTYTQSAPYQSFPALPTYPTNVIPSYIYPQHTNLIITPPPLPPTPKAHVNNTNVSNALSSIPEHQNEDEKDVIDVNKNEEQDTELNEDDIKVNNINNPWFNEEIASIVKLHRKTARKYHRSKTKPKELKQLCKKLEKKKRKLIRDAKEKYMRELMAKKGGETALKMASNLDVDANENENDERKSGYFALDVIQPICSIIWNRYWEYFCSGNHWKIDVDDILDLGVDEQMNLDLRELMNMIQDSAKKQWQYYNNSYTGKFSMYLMDVEDVLDIG